MILSQGIATASIRRYVVAVSSVFIIILNGCAGIGPRTVLQDRFDYTSAIGDSWKQQMLINIVRTRYGDTPIFLDISSVIGQYSLESGASVNGQVAKQGYGDVFAAMGLHSTYTDRPTITYIPLSGDKFTRSLMKPLPPSVVLALIQSGYPIDLVLRVCVHSINNVKNHFGGIARQRFADPEFYPLIERMRRIQYSGDIGLRVQKKNEQEAVLITLQGNADKSLQDDILFVRKTLGLDLSANEFRVIYGSMGADDHELAMLTRSIREIIVDVASYIDVPAIHVEEQQVNPTVPDEMVNGVAVSPLIKIYSSSDKPLDAFVAIPYQDHWFWISKSDMRSKSLFSFLMFIFSLTETGGKEGAPIITVPAG